MYNFHNRQAQGAWRQRFNSCTKKERGNVMKKVGLKDVKTYEAPGHFGMTAMRLHGKEETGATKFWMGLSHFLPGGGAEWAYEDNPLEKIYFVLKGRLQSRRKRKNMSFVSGTPSFSVPMKEERSSTRPTSRPTCLWSSIIPSKAGMEVNDGKSHIHGSIDRQYPHPVHVPVSAFDAATNHR
jgi:hypothetical protein